MTSMTQKRLDSHMFLGTKFIVFSRRSQVPKTIFLNDPQFLICQQELVLFPNQIGNRAPLRKMVFTTCDRLEKRIHLVKRKMSEARPLLVFPNQKRLASQFFLGTKFIVFSWRSNVPKTISLNGPPFLICQQELVLFPNLT